MIMTPEKLEQQVSDLVCQLWSTTAGVRLERVHRSLKPEDIGHSLAGCVRIGGAWEGAVVVHCAPELAKRATRAMLSVEPEQATQDDLRDALGEIVNITGGNIKAVMPGPSHLSLPIVAEGDDLVIRAPGHTPLMRLAFESSGMALLVSLLKKDGESHGS